MTIKLSMKPSNKYHKAEEKRSDAKPVILFIAAAICLVLSLELLKSGEISFELPGFIQSDRFTTLSLVDPDRLKEIHSQYMNRGINTEEFYNQNKQNQLPAYRKEVPTDNSSARQYSEIDQQGSKSLADVLNEISPAVGPAKELTKFEIRKGQFKRDAHKKRIEEQVVKYEKNVLSIKEEELLGDGTSSTEVIKKQTPDTKTPSAHNLKKIVIIIDDMGINAKNSREVEDLPGPLTLSYLPYAKNLPKHTVKALEKGHEIMVHLPMEPMNGDLDGGPAVLKIGQDKQKFLEILEWGLSQFSGYKGVNNHMGSRLTQNYEAMSILMDELKARNLYFIDSVTIATSIGAEIAEEKGIPHEERDIFLDHEITKEFIKDALIKLEAVAKYKGYAIAIGHPHRETIDILKEWLPTLKDKGLELVAASTVIDLKEKEHKVAEN